MAHKQLGNLEAIYNPTVSMHLVNMNFAFKKIPYVTARYT